MKVYRSARTGRPLTTISTSSLLMPVDRCPLPTGVFEQEDRPRPEVTLAGLRQVRLRRRKTE